MLEFPSHIHSYTDGSRRNNRTAFAYSIDQSISSFRIRNSASVFTAELMAIYNCLQDITRHPPNTKFLILTDSLSSLYAISDLHSSHPIVQRILLIQHAISLSNMSLTLVWTPSHIGLTRNDMVDSADKPARKLPKITDATSIPHSELKN